MKRFITSIIAGIYSISLYAFADISLIPKDNNYEQSTSGHINAVTTAPDTIKAYNDAASKMTLEQKMNSGIMDRNTIPQYLAFLVKVIMQASLAIGAITIIYSGYLYATGVFTGNAAKGQKAIKNAIIGIIIVAFSAAIIRILTVFFL